jgi:DNA end-binding protein Ku
MSTATARPRRKRVTKSPGENRGGARRASKREAREDYGPLGRPVWSGSISFGLVNIPVRLHTAVRGQRVVFHMLHDQDHARLRRRFVCPAHGKEVHPEHIIRGYEWSDGHYVIVRDEELEACAPEKTKAIEITDFVELSDIDPLHFDRPYYVIPQAGASKPYRLLVEAVARSKRVGLARVVMHEKEHLAALRPLNGLLCLETMYFADEIVPVDEIEDLPRDVRFADKELHAAGKIIKDLSGDFDPADFKDAYRQCIREMVEKKAKSDGVVEDKTADAGDDEEAAEERPARSAGNLMAALEASLAAARGHSGRKMGSSGKRRKRS